MKKIKGLKQSHTSPNKIGMGDYYGTGVRNPIGKPRDVFSEKAGKPRDMGKPPRTLA